MPKPSRRSKSLRKVFVRVVSKTKTTHKRRKCNIPKCGTCGKELKGMSKTFEFQIKKMPKTKKRATRPYSNLCSACMRKKIIEGARKNA